VFPSSPLSDVVSVDPIADYVRILAARRGSYYRVGSDSGLCFVFKGSAIFRNPSPGRGLDGPRVFLADFVGNVTSCVILIACQSQFGVPAFPAKVVALRRIPAPQKQKEQRISPLLPGSYPPQGTSPNSDYCSCTHAALEQVACATIGAACAAWSFLWIAPSVFAQKEFTPVVLKEAGAPPAV